MTELTSKREKELLDKAADIKTKKNLKGKVVPVIVFGREGEKEEYVAFFGEPTMKAMSKYMSMSKTDEMRAMQVLAGDLFIEGDRELVDDESLFLFGTMQTVGALLATRQAIVVGL